MTDTQTSAAVDRVAQAISKADASFGYSFNMTKLVEGVATHTLTMDGFDPVDFEDRDDGYRTIEARRNRMRADAILAALSPHDEVAKLREALSDMLWAFVDSEDAEEARSIQRSDAETAARTALGETK